MRLSKSVAAWLLVLSGFGCAASDGDQSTAFAEWDEWYLPVGNGCTLYVLELGRGDPVVVLHGGFGHDHGYLLDAVAGFDDDHRIVLYDQRGSLRSPCPDSLITVAQHVEDLDRLRAALGLERVTLVGHSMGTRLAMEYLEAHPRETGTVVLMGAVPPKSPTPEDSALVAEQQAATEAWVARSAIEEVIRREGLDREDLSAREATHQWRIRFAGGNLYHVDRWRQMRGGRVFYNASAGQAAARTLRQDFDFTEDIDAHPYPVTVLIGDSDYVDPDARLWRRWSRDLDGFELVVIEQAGHALWLDQPEEVRYQLRRALAKGR
jgi:proline iminopeptidase